MKRKYVPLRADPMRNHLAVRVEVQSAGASWFMDVKVPWEMIDHRALYEAAELERERRWRTRMVETDLDVPLFC